MSTELAVTLANDLTEIPRLATLVESFFRDHGIDSGFAVNVNLALDEVLTNIISYGYRDASAHTINVTLVLEKDVVKATVEDDACAFDPRTALPPDIESPLEARPLGGLGVHLVRQLMDRIEYVRSNGRNRLVLWKFL
jgi:anti-sigma regulatory factor (Ser/Thr protein kinase)